MVETGIAGKPPSAMPVSDLNGDVQLKGIYWKPQQLKNKRVTVPLPRKQEEYIPGLENKTTIALFRVFVFGELILELL